MDRPWPIRNRIGSIFADPRLNRFQSFFLDLEPVTHFHARKTLFCRMSGSSDQESSRKRQCLGKQPAAEPHASPVEPSSADLRAIINRPRFCPVPHTSELANRFEGWCLDGLHFDQFSLDIYPSDDRSVPEDLDVLRTHFAAQLDETKAWMEKHLGDIERYHSRKFGAWKTFACDLQRLNRENLERIALLEKDKAVLIQVLKSQDDLIAELSSSAGRASPGGSPSGSPK